jgi:hypothetical protein
VQNFATKARPLTDLLTKDSNGYWTADCEKAFQSLKKGLVEAPILAFPDFNQKFILTTDASKRGFGAVLSQIQDDGKEHPVAYASTATRRGQENHSAFELEFSALAWAVEYFSHYLRGQHFTIYTDCQALTHIPKANRLSGKWARYAITLQSYNYTIIYKKGKTNHVADALSRYSTWN